MECVCGFVGDMMAGRLSVQERLLGCLVQERLLGCFVQPECPSICLQHHKTAFRKTHVIGQGTIPMYYSLAAPLWYFNHSVLSWLASKATFSVHIEKNKKYTL